MVLDLASSGFVCAGGSLVGFGSSATGARRTTNRAHLPDIVAVPPSTGRRKRWLLLLRRVIFGRPFAKSNARRPRQHPWSTMSNTFPHRAASLTAAALATVIVFG